MAWGRTVRYLLILAPLRTFHQVCVEAACHRFMLRLTRFRDFRNADRSAFPFAFPFPTLLQSTCTTPQHLLRHSLGLLTCVFPAAALRYELGDQHTFHFVEGTVPSPLAPGK